MTYLNNLSDEDMRELTGFIALQAKEDAGLFGRKPFFETKQINSETMVVPETDKMAQFTDFATTRSSKC
jgi:hypothetical protein